MPIFIYYALFSSSMISIFSHAFSDIYDIALMTFVAFSSPLTLHFLYTFITLGSSIAWLSERIVFI